MSLLKALPPKKLLFLGLGIVIVIVIVGGGAFFFLSSRGPKDTKKPELHLTNLAADEWLSTDEDKVTINGLAVDESEIEKVDWKKEDGKTGSATVTNGEWSLQDIPLDEGDNKITITATDKGGNTSEVVVNVVYNPQVLFSNLTLSQDFIFKDGVATQIIARAGVETDAKEGIGTVNLYQINGDQKKKLTQMFDNGVVANGDDIPGDTIFSGTESFSSTTSNTILLRVGTTVKGSSKVLYSGILKLKVLDRPTQEQISTIFLLNDEISSKFEELQQSEGDKDAAQKLVEELEKRDDIEIAGVSENGYGVWWVYKELGILAGINNNPEKTRGKETERVEKDKTRSPPASVQGLKETLSSPIRFGVPKAQAAEKELEVKSTKAIYLGPYLHQFGNTDDYHKGWQVIKNSKCPECQITEQKDKEVTVEDFKTLSNYGLVVIPSHGDTWFNGKFAGYCETTGDCPETLKNGGGFVNIFVDQVVDATNIFKYLPDLFSYRLALDASDNTLAVLPPYITAYNGTFPNSVVYIGTCRSAHNFTMAAAFLSKGAKAYYGFSEYVGWNYAGDVTEEMFKSFINKGKTAKESFDDAVATKGASDGSNPPAFFSFYGSPNLKMGGKKIQNAGFEEGLLGWQQTGDARVITRLASLKPTEGKKMAIISTGLGSVFDSNSALSQKICSKEGKATLSFKYNIVSEEPMEWVGSKYDDQFVVFVMINGKAKTIVNRRINNSKWKKVGGINFAGGDSTTYMTGWASVSKSLGELKPDDTLQIEFRVRDKGDSRWDTAALIDNVNLEVK